MSARKDDNPPDDWADKVTGTSDKNKDKQEGEISPSFTVTDHRHWAGDDDDALDDAGEPAVKTPAYVQALEDELQEKDQTLKQYISQYKAAKEDMNDAISRIEREKEREINFRIADMAKAFLAILDDLQTAAKAADSGDDLSSLKKGLDLIAQSIEAALGNIDITPIEALGEPLDPSKHDAVAVETVDDPEKDGIIIEELKKGYKLGDVLVRPSSVVVGKYEK